MTTTPLQPAAQAGTAMTSAPKPELPDLARAVVYAPAELERLVRAYGTACAKWQQERDAVIADSFATCGCNGKWGRCLEDDPPHAIAAAIRNQQAEE